MKLLMHICCANCALLPLKHLDLRGIDVRGLWFNPNIHPEDEYLKRLDSVQKLEGLQDLEIEYAAGYGIRKFMASLEGHSGIRCEACYRMRLDETARTARKMGLDGFTTSLLASPFQKFDLIVETGQLVAKRHSMPFYWQDLRHGWREGARLSRQLGLYRQYYCGCVFSKEERDEERARKSRAATPPPAFRPRTA